MVSLNFQGDGFLFSGGNPVRAGGGEDIYGRFGVAIRWV